jgi:hypothetical protein
MHIHREIPRQKRNPRERAGDEAQHTNGTRWASPASQRDRPENDGKRRRQDSHSAANLIGRPSEAQDMPHGLEFFRWTTLVSGHEFRKNEPTDEGGGRHGDRPHHVGDEPGTHPDAVHAQPLRQAAESIDKNANERNQRSMYDAIHHGLVHDFFDELRHSTVLYCRMEHHERHG